MEKLAERIGIFDFWAVFFPGSIGMLELLFFISTFWSIHRKCPFLDVVNTIALDNITILVILIFISLFLGIIFQEIGRWLRIKTKKPNAADIFLNPSAGIFMDDEYTLLRSFLIKYGWDGKSTKGSKAIFHRINAEAQECEVAGKYVKLGVLQNMSASLSAVMLIGTITSTGLFIYSLLCNRRNIALLMGGVDLICVFLIVLFFKRSIRFNRYWVRNIIFAMLEKNERIGKT